MNRMSKNWQLRKRWVAIWAVIFLLGALVPPARGEDGDTGLAADPRPSAGSPAAPSLEAVMELVKAQQQEIESLRASLRDQQAVTAQLEARLNAAGFGPPAGAPATPVPTAPAETSAQSDLGQKVASLETSVASYQRNLEEQLKRLGPFTFSGDLRLRAEPTFGGPVDRSQDRFRERIRLRFNADAQFNDQIKGGLSLASGDLNDPISTNQSLNQYDTRKPIAIDRAYATYNPAWFRPLTLTGGKFAYSWFNTELVWDKDLNPEGASETLAFNVETPVLQKVALVGFQLPFAENKRTSATDKSLYNTMVYGEQLQTAWQLGSRLRLSAYASYYDWKFADSVAFSLLVSNSASPGDGLLALKSVGEQNSIATVTATNPITGVKTVTSAQFGSKFGILDSLAQIDVRTPSERWPLTLVGDFAQNTRACENLRNLPAAAVLSAPCDHRARHGYWLEASAGRTLKKGDWQFSYSRIAIQREAVLGAFNYSEIFPSSDVEIHRSEILYQLFDNVTLQMNGLFGRPLADAGNRGPVQPLWERFQFDMTYKF